MFKVNSTGETHVLFMLFLPQLGIYDQCVNPTYAC